MLRRVATCGDGLVGEREEWGSTSRCRILLPALTCANGIGRTMGGPRLPGSWFPLQDVEAARLPPVRAPLVLDRQVARALEFGQVRVHRTDGLPAHIGRQLGT